MRCFFLLKSFLAFSATVSVVSAAPAGCLKMTELKNSSSSSNENGAPGTVCTADPYNSLGNNWNKTYGATEPQQIHMSWTDESDYARIQFATLAPISKSVLIYWPKNSSKKITIYGDDFVFADGDPAQRKLYLHNIKTDLLVAGTTYEYQVGAMSESDTIWSKEYEFHTASTGDTFSFIASGDIGACNAVSVSHMMALAKTHRYDFVTIAGDQAYDLDDFDGTKGDEYLNFMQDLFAQLPYLGSVGNHESNYNFSHYKNRFNIVPYAESNFVNSMMYSINYKSLHLVSFSTEVYFEGSENEILTATNWLEQDLTEANKHRDIRPWIIFLTHHPIYCSVDNSECTTDTEIIRNSIEDLLNKYNVDVYLSGHVHNYERTYPVFKSSRTATTYVNAPSIFQMVVGNGGQPGGTLSFGSGAAADWSAVRFDGYGYTTFTVSPTKLSIVHKQANTDGSLGGVIDSFDVSK